MLQKSAKNILQVALKAVDPNYLIKQQIKRKENVLIFENGMEIELDKFDNIRIFGIGKGVAPMARAMEELLGDKLTGGDVIVKYEHGEQLEKIQTYEAGHPIPDNNTLKSTHAILKNVKDLNENDLVFVLLTGGGSALLEKLPKSVTLENLQELNRILLGCGATIHEINCIRKHISLIKGGQLARHIHPAKIVILALSDVVGDDLSVIASGPTSPDESSFDDALEVLKKYNVTNKIPENILHILHFGAAKKIKETPDEDDVIFRNVENSVIGSNRVSLLAAENEAKNLGYNTMILTSMLEGEAKEIAHMISSIIREIQEADLPVQKPACLLIGGEPTVNIHGDGKGGRNQELALAVAINDIKKQYLFLSCGSDGTDGPTDAAGAFASHITLGKAELLGLSSKDYLANNDAYNYFMPLRDLIKTGPTKTNVMDVIIVLVP